MKKLTGILLLFLITAVSAQQQPVSFSEIDYRVKSIAPAPPALLAQTLTEGYTNEKEKLRAIFSWITEHISYRVKKTYRSNAYAAAPVIIDTVQWKTANDIVAETVLSNQSAFCDGYARLFKTLCDYAGLRSAIITGYARTEGYGKIKFNCNHTWNAVYIDSSWRLLDVTWASGYTSYRGDEFFKNYNEYYFLTAPEDFFRDHYPDDLRWTLLNKPPLIKEFQNNPYKNKAFGKYRITSYMPATGIIEAAVGDTIQFEVETNDPQSDKKMAPDTALILDDALQASYPFINFLEANTDNAGKKLRYTYIVDNENTDWLQLLYNKDMILRYKLKIRKNRNNNIAGNIR
jgi:Transglutaminase-like superfamily